MLLNLITKFSNKKQKLLGRIQTLYRSHTFTCSKLILATKEYCFVNLYGIYGFSHCTAALMVVLFLYLWSRPVMSDFVHVQNVILVHCQLDAHSLALVHIGVSFFWWCILNFMQLHFCEISAPQSYNGYIFLFYRVDK